MKRISKRVTFGNGRGQQLAGIMEWPTCPPRCFTVFSHCFTCTKDLKAAVRISRRLAERGYCVLRYDFTGLSGSTGDFSKTNFTTNCLDLKAAAAWLGREFEPPRLLIGHSLGGTATAVTADQIESVDAIVTIASLGSTVRLAGFLDQSNPQIGISGSGRVVIGGSEFLLRAQLLHDLRSYDIEAELSRLQLPILAFHSPDDETLPYAWGLQMFEAIQSPKSFVTLDQADHLLVNRPGDVTWVADLIDQWAGRYLPPWA